MLTPIEANSKSQLKFQSSFEMRVAINPLLRRVISRMVVSRLKTTLQRVFITQGLACIMRLIMKLIGLKNELKMRTKNSCQVLFSRQNSALIKRQFIYHASCAVSLCRCYFFD